MIDRAVRLAQATSSSTSAALLVAFNLVPLAGVLLWGWNVATILVLYWVENGIVGVLNIPKMVLASGPDEPPSRQVDVRGIGPVTVPRRGSVEKAALIPFFLVHYGIFWLVHGIFVFTLPMIAGAAGPGGLGGFSGSEGIPVFEGLPDGSIVVLSQARPSGPDLGAVALAAIGLAISHGASFMINFVGRGEYRAVSTARQMFAPYGRLVILHLTILFGAFVSMAIGSPVGAIIVLVLLKTAVDLKFHLSGHATINALPDPLPPRPPTPSAGP